MLMVGERERYNLYTLHWLFRLVIALIRWENFNIIIHSGDWNEITSESNLTYDFGITTSNCLIYENHTPTAVRPLCGVNAANSMNFRYTNKLPSQKHKTEENFREQFWAALGAHAMASSVAPDTVFKLKDEGQVASFERVIMIAIDFLSNNFRKHGRRPRSSVLSKR